MAFSSTKCMARSKPPGLYGSSVAALLLAALPIGLGAGGRLLCERERTPAASHISNVSQVEPAGVRTRSRRLAHALSKAADCIARSRRMARSCCATSTVYRLRSSSVSIPLTRRLFPTLLFVAAAASAALLAQSSPLPNRPGSLKFAAIGDNGTGDRPQYELAQQMTKVHATFPFDLVIMLGDNMYGGQSPADYVKKFEQPYAPLLAAGVKFQASLGNHDRPEQVSYKPYNMNGQRYYTYVAQQRPVLRARQHAHGSEAARMDRCRAERRARGLEDLLLPSPAVLERRPPRIVGRPARPARADLRQARRQRGVLGSRPRLRAHQAAEGHLLLRVGCGGPAEEGQHGTVGPDRRGVRPGPELHGRRDRRRGHVLPGDLAHRPDRRLRRDPPAGEDRRHGAGRRTQRWRAGR